MGWVGGWFSCSIVVLGCTQGPVHAIACMRLCSVKCMNSVSCNCPMMWCTVLWQSTVYAREEQQQHCIGLVGSCQLGPWPRPSSARHAKLVELFLATCGRLLLLLWCAWWSVEMYLAACECCQAIMLVSATYKKS